MKMDFNELTTTITENESKNILNMFEMLLKEQSNYLKDERSSSVKETVTQNCFISLGLCGKADGLWFPNAQFNFINTMKKFVCLCIYKNKPAICYRHEKIEGYFIEYMENIIYSYEERETRKNLLSYQETLTDSIKLLKSIQQVKKSDGSKYKIFSKNFTSSLAYFKISADYNLINISGVEQCNNSSRYYSDRIHIKNYHDVSDPLSPENIMAMINENIEFYNEQLKQTETKLSCLHSEALEIEYLFRKILKVGSNIKNKDFMRDYINANLYKLSKGE